MNHTRTLPAGDHVALSDLAYVYGCSTANLRQRIERGTLQAEKVGKQWIVARAEAERLLAEQNALIREGKA